MKKILAGLMALLFLSGCESLYYDLVMDSRDQGKGASMDKGTDSSHIGRYR